MPIYEYECEVHGRFEVIKPLSLFTEYEQCPQQLQNELFELRCTAVARLVPSLCAMHPDNMWSGIKNEQGYFTSKKQHLSYLKQHNMERADRSILEEVKKKSANKVEETLKKNAAKTEKWLAKELASA